MLRLYGVKKAEKLVAEYSPWVEAIAARYGIPAACMKAVLRKEIGDIDLFDPLADTLVALNWRRFDLCRLFSKTYAPRKSRGVFAKTDSSTGYAQIFAWVAIDAMNFALSHGLEGEEGLGLMPGERLSKDSARDRERMWRRLGRDKKFNIRMGMLNLIAAGEEVNGHTDFERYTPEEYKKMFTRYNANTRAITPYGEEVYQYYQQYINDNNIM